MKNVDDKYVSLREAVGKKILSVRDSVFAIFLLSVIVKKMAYESNGGGHFNINPDTVMVLKEKDEPVKIMLVGEDNPHQPCHGKPDFDTNVLNPCFRAPETFLGRYTSASDIYSMGVLLAYLVQGRYPYPCDETMGVFQISKLIRDSKNPNLNDVPEDLRGIVAKAMCNVSRERYKDAEELGNSLLDYLRMEKPKSFSCFSDTPKKNNEKGKGENEMKKEDIQGSCNNPQEPHLDVDMSVRVGDGFNAVAGMEDIKHKLRRDFVEIVSHRELAKEFGIMPSNMLFFGVPGSGKTYITQRLAEECGFAFCSVKPSDLGSIWLHGSQGLIKELFQKAEAKAKENKKGCILLIDEIDALCGIRNATGKEHQADEVAEWLTQLNDCVEKNVFVVGTTNRLDVIDPALTRHGRIDQIIYVGLPDLDCRKQLFELELSKRPHEEIDTEELAKITDGYTSSDISYMVKETARYAFEASINAEPCTVVKISEKMLRDVVMSTRPSVTRDEVRRYEKMRDDYMKSGKKERPRIGFVV